jgi:hypothetical protein
MRKDEKFKFLQRREVKMLLSWTVIKFEIKNLIVKYWWAILLAIVVWNYIGIDRFFYKYFYGKSTSEKITLSTEPLIEDVILPTPGPQDLYVGKYKIKGNIRKKFTLSGTLLYRDDNSSFDKKYFWNAGPKSGKLHKQIASVDLTIAYGKTGVATNAENLDVKLDPNLASLSCKILPCKLDATEWGNFHVLPMNKTIHKGLLSLPESKNVPVYIEGYLIDWNGVGEYDDLSFKTILAPGQSLDKNSDGKKTDTCYQIYLTKLIYDGRVFE